MKSFNTVSSQVVAVRNTPVVRPSFSLSRVRWVRVGLAVMAPVVLASSMYAHMSKPVLEDSVEWVKVHVEAGYGYDAAIKAAYAQVGEYDLNKVDIRDLRYIAKEHNGNEALYAGTVIEVPVYTGSGKYR